MPLHAEPLVNDRLIEAVTDYLQTHDARIFPFTANFDDEKRAAFDRDLRIGLSDLTESGSKRGTSSVGYITSDRRLQVVVREWLDADGEWPKGQDPYNPLGVASVLHPAAEEQSLKSTVASANAPVDDALLVEEALAYEESLGNATATDLSDAVLVDGGELDGTPTDFATADDDLLAADVEALEEVDAVGAEPLAEEVVVVDEEILVVESVGADGTSEEVLIIEETFETEGEAAVSTDSDDVSQASAGFVAADSGDFQDELDAASNESALVDYSVANDQSNASGSDSGADSHAADMAVAGEPPFEVQAESEMVTAGGADSSATRSSKLPTDGEGTAWVAGDGTRDVPAGFPIKGNADSGIYHPLESSGYNNTIAEIYFRDGETAEQFGYRLPKNLAHLSQNLGDKVADAADDAADKDQ